MKRTFRHALLLLALIWSSAGHAETLGMVTGPATGTYIAIGRDIAKLAKTQGIDIDVKESGGSIDNIKRIHSSENAALGIVQSDVLGFMQRSSNPETMKITHDLRMVLPLYKEEVHVLARRDIKRFEDLKGKRVIIGEAGSGNMLTAVNLLALMNIKVGEPLRMSPPEGVLAVLEGSADAVIFVGGKPVKLFKNIENLENPEYAKFTPLLKSVHFLPLSAPQILAEYSVAEITHKDYQFVNIPVQTIAVQAVLVTYDFHNSEVKKEQQQCRDLGKLAGIIRKGLPELRKDGHAKWQEVNLDSPAPLWQKDACSWPTSTRKKSKNLGQDLLGVVKDNNIPSR